MRLKLSGLLLGESAVPSLGGRLWAGQSLAPAGYAARSLSAIR